MGRVRETLHDVLRQTDTVLLALGFAPTTQAAAAFESVAPVTVLGDAQQPRKILFAVGDAHEAVRKLSD